MATFLFHELIYGPIHSRRLGNSLGVNLLPTEKKYCNFNCVYCECGANIPGHVGQLARRQELAQALESKLKELHANGDKLDSITFAGNGEPTIHPDFHGVIEDTVRIRNQYFPKAQISVLTNATRVCDDKIVETLRLVDNRILKIDAGSNDMALLIDRPVGKYSLEKQVELFKKFNGDFTLQTMFLAGVVDGKEINNMTDSEVDAWIEIVKQLNPKMVMIYTIARDTPEQNLRKATHDELMKIRDRVEALGIKISVSE